MNCVEVGEQECPMCEELTVHRKRVGPCNHGICVPCLELWLKHHPGPTFRCPECKEKCFRPLGGVHSLEDDVPEELHAPGKDGEVQFVVLKGDMDKEHDWFKRVLGPSAMDYIGGINDELRYKSEDERRAWVERENARLHTEHAGDVIIDSDERESHRRAVGLFEDIKSGAVRLPPVEYKEGELMIADGVFGNGGGLAPRGRPLLLADRGLGADGGFASKGRQLLIADGGLGDPGLASKGRQLVIADRGLGVDAGLGLDEDLSLDDLYADCFEKLENKLRRPPRMNALMGNGLRIVEDERKEVRLPEDMRSPTRSGPKKKNAKDEWDDGVAPFALLHTKTDEGRKVEEERKRGKKSLDDQDKKVDFVMNEAGELCVRFWERVGPPGSEVEWARTGKMEKCLDVQPTDGTRQPIGQTMARLRKSGLLKEGTYVEEDDAPPGPEKVNIAAHAPTPEEICQSLGLDEDAMSDTEIDPKMEKIWCRICIRNDRMSYVSFICIDCTGRFCDECGWRHRQGIKEPFLRRDCTFHYFHVSNSKDAQCARCVAVATHVAPIAKQGKTKILGAKGWRSDRYNSTEACDRKIKQLQDKQLIQFCRKKFNLDSTDKIRVREHDDFVRMQEREREEMRLRREHEEIERMRKREQIVRMRKMQMEMKIRQQEEEKRIRECDVEIEAHDKELEEAIANLKALEDKKNALVRRKEAIIEGKEEFIREVNDQAKRIDDEIEARLSKKLNLNKEIEDTVAEANRLVAAGTRVMTVDALDRIQATSNKLEELNALAHEDEMNLGAFYKQLRDRSERENEVMQAKYKDVVDRMSKIASGDIPDAELYS